MRVLVTGGLGYIGSHTCVALQDSGYGVCVIDNQSNSYFSTKSNIEKITKKKVIYYDVDISKFSVLAQCFDEFKPDAVIHFAGVKSVPESIANPLLYYQQNVANTINLLSVMEQQSVNKLVFSSSATVYGEQNGPSVREDEQLNPKSVYGRTKQICETLISDWATNKGRLAVALRYFNPVGAHESGLIYDNPLNKPQNLFPVILNVLKSDTNYLSVFGNDYPTKDGTALRDYIHVSDLADAHTRALETLNLGFNAFNVGTGTSYSVLEVLDCFNTNSNTPIAVKIESRRDGDIAISNANVDKIFKSIGWKCTRDLDDMVKSALRIL